MIYKGASKNATVTSQGSLQTNIQNIILEMQQLLHDTYLEIEPSSTKTTLLMSTQEY